MAGNAEEKEEEKGNRREMRVKLKMLKDKAENRSRDCPLCSAGPKSAIRNLLGHLTTHDAGSLLTRVVSLVAPNTFTSPSLTTRLYQIYPSPY
jgi:hypothetical protein